MGSARPPWMTRLDPTGALPWLVGGCTVAWGLMLLVLGIVGKSVEGPALFVLPALSALVLVALNLLGIALFARTQPTRLRQRVVGYLGAAVFTGMVTLPVALLAGWATQNLHIARDPVDAVVLWNLLGLPNEVVQLGAAAALEAVVLAVRRRR